MPDAKYPGARHRVAHLDQPRQAVGDARLNYFGSYVGNTYGSHFPRNVRALVIDAVFNPRLWSSGRADRVRPGRPVLGF